MNTANQLKEWRERVRKVSEQKPVDYYYGRLTGIDDAISIVERVEKFDGCDGCSTGDCPHNNVNDCVKAQAKTIAEQAATIDHLAAELAKAREDERRLKFLCGWGHPTRFAPTVSGIVGEVMPLMSYVDRYVDTEDNNPNGTHIIKAVREWIDDAQAIAVSAGSEQTPVTPPAQLSNDELEHAYACGGLPIFAWEIRDRWMKARKVMPRVVNMLRAAGFTMEGTISDELKTLFPEAFK